MGKKKQPWDEDVKVQPSDFFSQAVKAQQVDNGRNDVIVSALAQQVVIGLPLFWSGSGPVHRHHSVGVRWLLQNNVYPLGRMAELVGKSRSFKSTALYEILRWHVLAGGGYRFLLAEPRDTADLRSSVLGPECDTLSPVIECSAIEDWQVAATEMVKDATAKFSAIGSCPFPGAIGVDSLTGVTCRATVKSTWDDGHASLDYARDANLISRWTKVFFTPLSKWPFSFIGTNHLKESPGKAGYGVDRRVPGGAALEFAGTFILRFSRDEQGDYINAEEEGRVINIYTEKNSLGSDHRKLRVRVAWRNDSCGVQSTVWKWHEAGIEMLTSMTGEARSAVYEVVDFYDVQKSHKTGSSKTLGLTKATWTELSEAIEQNPKIREDLDMALGVRQRYVWKPGLPYSQQLQEARDEADTKYSSEKK